MKPRILFYILAIYILAAFSWLTYSSIRNSEKMRDDEMELLWANGYKANADVLNQVSSDILQDSNAIKKYVAEKFPDYQIVYLPQSESYEEYGILPKEEAEQAIVKKFERQKWMYVSEGIVFVIFLLWGLIWIYYSFRQRIELNRQQNNFLLSVTHELKTPIAAVKLYLQTLQKRELDKEQTRQMVENSLKETERLNHLVENVLIATQIEGKNYHYHFEPVDFSALVKQQAETARAAFAGKATVTSDIPDGMMVKADAFTLGLAVSNLVENACKYGKNEAAEVKLQVRAELGQVILSVEDNGKGIAQEEQKKIFDKFYRSGDESTRKTKGTGLGLYIVKQVLDNHKASVQLVSEPGKGSIFTIKLASYDK